MKVMGRSLIRADSSDAFRSWRHQSKLTLMSSHAYFGPSGGKIESAKAPLRSELTATII